MTLNIIGNEYDLKFTFNSFKYIEDFDLSVLNELENKPFKMIGMLETLFYGAMNHDRKVICTASTTSELLERYIEDGGSAMELFELLMLELEESDFFKNLQK